MGLSLCYGVLAWQSNQPVPMAFAVFAGIWLVAFVLSLFQAWTVKKFQISLAHVIFWCVVVRLILVSGTPVYEDDYYRYLWDGKQTVETGTPYGSAPQDFFDTDQEPQWEEVLSEINNPGLPTIYGPVNQYVFAIAHWIDPANVRVLQLIMALVDIAVIAVLVRLASLAWVAMYGFSPLILKEFALTAHPDLLSVLPLLLGLLFWKRNWFYWSAVALGFAVASKLFAFLLVPLLLRWRWRPWLVFAAVVLLLHLPLQGAGNQFESLSAMASAWFFNAPIYYLTYAHIDFTLMKQILSVVFLLCCAGYFFRGDYQKTDQIPRGDWLFMGLLLVSPVFNPWYFVFVLVFAVIYPSVWAWLASLTLVFSYATGLQLSSADLEVYEHPPWALMVEFVPIALAIVITLIRKYGKSP